MVLPPIFYCVYEKNITFRCSPLPAYSSCFISMVSSLPIYRSGILVGAGITYFRLLYYLWWNCWKAIEAGVGSLKWHFCFFSSSCRDLFITWYGVLSFWG